MSDLVTVRLPDIGDFTDVEVIEIHVSSGDSVSADDSLITLESDKATMDVPSPDSGEVADIVVAIGDKISEGDVILTLNSVTDTTAKQEPQTVSKEPEPEIEEQSTIEESVPEGPSTETVEDSSANVASDPFAPKRPPVLPPPVERSKGVLAHASPAVRRFARELGADLSQIRGTGAKGRIIKEDVQSYVKGILQEGPMHSRGGIIGPPPIPEVDFSQFGETEVVRLSKIKKITGDRLHRSWLDIPHVTHHDEADISELDIFRKAIDAEERIAGTRVTILAFICKAIVNALQQYPNFNASLSPDRQKPDFEKILQHRSCRGHCQWPSGTSDSRYSETRGA